MGARIVASSEADSEYIHKRLQAHNAPFMSDWEELSFHMEEDGRIVAGVVAERTADTVEVAYLFVEESCRGRGLGRALLERVEDTAREKGARRIALNTYSFQAPNFYPKLGYREVLKLEPCFGQHSQFYFLKEL